MSKKPVKIVRRSYSDEYRRNAVSLIENQGYTTAQAARELGVNANLLRKWRQKYGKLASADSKITQTEQQELDQLRRKNHRLRIERDLLKKYTARRNAELFFPRWGLLRQRKELRFQFIDDHREEWPMTLRCDVLEVRRSGFYAWRNRPVSVRSIRQANVVSEIKQIHSETHKDVYGSPRMHLEQPFCE